MRVAVTGGSGIVGRAVVRHLVAAGHEVRGLARSSHSAKALVESGAVPFDGDVLDSPSLERLMSGCARVFHIAGVNEMCSRDPARMWRVNVDGTLLVLEASARAGVARVIHTSSAATIGESWGTTGSETSPHRGHFLSEYERSKSEAERLALGSHRDIEVVSVNPSSVQGPGRATGTGALLLTAAKGRIPFLVDAVVSLVDIDDCARGHLLAAEHGRAGDRYLVSGATVTVREVVRIMRRRQGRTRTPWFVDPGVVEALAPVVDAGCRMIGKESPLCPESARVLRHGHRYDGSRATRDLGLEYTPLETTLTRTLDWFEAESML